MKSRAMFSKNLRKAKQKGERILVRSGAKMSTKLSKKWSKDEREAEKICSRSGEKLSANMR